ncbi:MAG: hypothetical protein IJM57_10880 [Lachnospiraceae bacterium]|nr:hypothetical protein [Lachnospiraceae bacterium]
MRGKDKCRILKQIRKQIADENDIPFVVEECKHKGECKGTCPKCEAELKALEKELSLRHRVGKAVAVAGVAAGLMVTTSACTLSDGIDLLKQIASGDSNGQVEVLEGDVADRGDYQFMGYVTEGEALPPELEGTAEADYTYDLPDDTSGVQQ